MATIRRVNAHFPLAESKPSPGVMNCGTEGLQFRFTVNDARKGYQYTVALSHFERDELIEAWAKLEKDFEGA